MQMAEGNAKIPSTYIQRLRYINLVQKNVIVVLVKIAREHSLIENCAVPPCLLLCSM